MVNCCARTCLDGSLRRVSGCGVDRENVQARKEELRKEGVRNEAAGRDLQRDVLPLRRVVHCDDWRALAGREALGPHRSAGAVGSTTGGPSFRDATSDELPGLRGVAAPNAPHGAPHRPSAAASGGDKARARRNAESGLPDAALGAHAGARRRILTCVLIIRSAAGSVKRSCRLLAAANTPELLIRALRHPLTAVLVWGAHRRIVVRPALLGERRHRKGKYDGGSTAHFCSRDEATARSLQVSRWAQFKRKEIDLLAFSVPLLLPSGNCDL